MSKQLIATFNRLRIACLSLIGARTTPVAPCVSMLSPEVYREELTRGVYTRVAQQLGLAKNGRSHVSRVAHGERRSPRVEQALSEEFHRIDAKVAEYRERYVQSARHAKSTSPERAA